VRGRAAEPIPVSSMTTYFLERSAELTLDPARRAERALAAAQAKYQAGAFEATLGLLATAEAGPPDQLRRARADRLRGQIAFSSSRGSDAPPLLLKAARQFEPLDSRLARETYLDALAAATFAGRLALGGGMREVAETRTSSSSGSPTPAPLTCRTCTPSPGASTSTSRPPPPRSRSRTTTGEQKASTTRRK
jgi:hypothetical protein